MPMAFDPEHAADGVWFGVSVIVLVASFQLVFLPTMVDRFRDRLFELRRDLFLLVADGRIAPTDMMYVYMRNTINAHIRYAERVTFVRGIIGPNMAMRLHPALRRAHRLDLTALLVMPRYDDVRDAMQEIRSKLGDAVAFHVVATSPV